MTFRNVYEDDKRADAYAKLEFPATYYLAYRDVPALIYKHVDGNHALDFGCGTGRSTRFLRDQGFDVVGVDISKDMIQKAREIDPDGDYILVGDGDLSNLEREDFDLILAAFTFDNIPGVQHRIMLLEELKSRLRKGGCILFISSTPEIYTHEWASFTTEKFVDENKKAGSGDKVKIIMKDVDDRRPVEDTIWFHDDYLHIFQKSGLELVETKKPLGKENEPYEWVNETELAPWILYVVKKG